MTYANTARENNNNGKHKYIRTISAETLDISKHTHTHTYSYIDVYIPQLYTKNPISLQFIANPLQF